MKKSLSTIAIIGLILSCVVLIFRKNEHHQKIIIDAPEEIIQNKDVTHYLDEELAQLLIEYMNAEKRSLLPYKKVVIISFENENQKPYVYFISSFLYRSSILKNGYFELNDHLILFADKENPNFDKFVKSENLEHGIPEGYINETSDEMNEVIDYDGRFKRIQIGKDGELIPE